MLFYWFLSIIIWGSAWLGALVYPTFLNAGSFSWGYVISVLMYQTSEVIVSVPFVIVALSALKQVIKNLIVQIKYGELLLSIGIPAVVSIAGGIYLLVTIPGLSLFILLTHFAFHAFFGTKKIDTSSPLDHAVNLNKGK